MSLFKTVAVCFLILICGRAKTQTTMQIGNVQSCIGNFANIPVNMSAMSNIGAITLFIGYDTAMVDSIYLTNINPLASNTMYNDMRVPPIIGPRIGKIGISWIDNTLNGINFNAGLFAMLKFRIKSGGVCQVNFMANCEIANSAGDTISISYSNGSLAIPENPVITAHPLPLSLNTTQNGFFSVTASDYDSIQWQINQGSGWTNIQNNAIYQGCTNDTLYISHPGATLDGVYFKCLVGNGCLSVPSDSAIIHVTVWSGNDIDLICSDIYPNPFNDYIFIDFSKSTFVEEINIFHADGKLARQIQKKEQSKHIFISQLSKLKRGTYFIEIVYKNKEANYNKNRYKLVKI